MRPNFHQRYASTGRQVLENPTLPRAIVCNQFAVNRASLFAYLPRSKNVFLLCPSGEKPGQKGIAADWFLGRSGITKVMGFEQFLVP